MADTNASAGATTLTTEQCNSFGSKCQTTAKDATAGCLGSWSFRCYPGVGVADSVANYPTGICARCLCNDNKALIADLPCVTLPAVATNSLPSSPGGVQGGGAGGVSSSPAPASPSGLCFLSRCDRIRNESPNGPCLVMTLAKKQLPPQKRRHLLLSTMEETGSQRPPVQATIQRVPSSINSLPPNRRPTRTRCPSILP
ncbi:hypothetical protein BC830DRAFT_1105164 [Chytriomyces sp. MP71]|nr:hypothetical protein BC830DRAFT_1105164 [Chytriomyces sp. MP71]